MGRYDRVDRKAARRSGDHELPVFDRGGAAWDGAIRAGFTPAGSLEIYRGRRRVAADRRPGVAVTARLLGDPKPGRAGRAPDCEDSRRSEESEQAYRLLGKEPPTHGRYAVLSLDEARDRAEILRPRRYRPAMQAAE
jgi:hypothetical protein